MTILVGLRSGVPAVLVTMTGPHPAMIVGFADTAEIDFAGLARALLDAIIAPPA